MLHKITAARAANPMRGERRTVTMLFADIQGSTAAAEGLDPEDWTDIINGAFEHLIAPVYRYEGTLARLLGDAVLAFFGAPIAHEDDPVRAVRAGLEIVEGMHPYKTGIADRWGIPIDVRVGINTGLVVVGEVGSDLRVEYTALGDAVNVAARMEQTADPSTVRVTRETWDLVSDQFAGEEIGPVEVKGKSEPVAAVRVVGHRETPEDAVGQSPLVGRSDEVKALEDLRERLVNGSGWVASIMGEAGVGKSRLLDEFRHHTLASGRVATDFAHSGDLAWMSAFSESYDVSIPYSSVRDLLRRWWSLDQADDPFGQLQKATGAVLEERTDAATYLGYVAGVPLPESSSEFIKQLEPPVLDARVRQAIISYLEAEASRRPVLVALEDVHWADPMSLAVIEDAMRLVEGASLGLVVSMRPYRDEPAWRMHEVAQRDLPHRYQTVELAALEQDSIEALLDTMLDGVELADDVRARILSRSDGNPLFIEQIARAIRAGEAGEEMPVPTGLLSLLTARLDRLEPESKLVAQMASVIGLEFDRPNLASLVGDGFDLDRQIPDLLRRGIFTEGQQGRRLVAFHHALMREAAYSTMLLRTRRELHGRLAEHLVATSPDALQEIARHFVEAGDMEKAFPHVVAAGEGSARSMALSDAIRFFNTALENIPAGADPELVVRAHDGLGVAYTLVPDLTQSEATYQRLVDYADSAGQPSAKVTALNRLAMSTATLSGDLAGARVYLDNARALATEVGDDLGLAQYHMNACTIAGLGGDIETSALHDEETARWGKKLGVEELRIEGLTRLAENTVWLMDFDRAVPAVEEAVEAATQAGSEHHIAVLNGLAVSRLRMREGDIESALRLTVEAGATLERYASFFTPLAHWLAAHLYSERGRMDAALDLLQQARRSSTETGMPFFVALTSAGQAHLYASLGMDEPMREARSAALAAVDTPVGDFVASTVWAEIGYAALARGDLGEAADRFDLGLATPSASQFWEKPRLLLGRALVSTAQDDATAAHRFLDEADTYLLGKEVRAYDGHVLHGRGLALLAEGQPEAAAAKLESALEIAASQRWLRLHAESATAAARARSSMGDTDAARRHLAAARAGVEEMMRSVEDPEIRQAMESVWLAPLGQTLAG